MENATKALLIAGGVLIAIVIISIAVFLFISFSDRTKEYNEIISATELQKFNSKFEVHVGRTDITAQEVVSMANLAKKYDGQVQIYLGNTPFPSTSPEEFLKDNLEDENDDKLFSCILNTSVTNPNPEYDKNGKIIKVKFKKNS